MKINFSIFFFKFKFLGIYRKIRPNLNMIWKKKIVTNIKKKKLIKSIKENNKKIGKSVEINARVNFSF